MALRTLCYRVPRLCTFTRYLSNVSRKELSDGKAVDEVTHTGQVWDKDDFRRARFVDREKQGPLKRKPYDEIKIANWEYDRKKINKQFAIDLIAEDPVVVCDAKTVWSDSGGALGHPRVFINLDKPGIHICGYSGRKFIHRSQYNEAEHGPSITYEQYMEEMRPTPRE